MVLFAVFVEVFLFLFEKEQEREWMAFDYGSPMTLGKDLVLTLVRCLCRAARGSKPWFQKFWGWFWAGSSHFLFLGLEQNSWFFLIQKLLGFLLWQHEVSRDAVKGAGTRLPGDDWDSLGFGALVPSGLGQCAQSQETCQCTMQLTKTCFWTPLCSWEAAASPSQCKEMSLC